MTITPYRPDDPVDLAADFVVEEGSAAFNHLGQALTSGVRFFLWLTILWLLAISKYLRVLDDKWVEHRTRKEAACQS